MQQYLKLLEEISSKGTWKPPAREGMPGTTSLFGYQFRHNLSDGFPLLTTKKLDWNNIVIELLWFLRGDTNIKFLVDNGCNIWNEDAYNYYKKRVVQFNEALKTQYEDAIKAGRIKEDSIPAYEMIPGTFERFIEVVKDNSKGGDDMVVSWGGDGIENYTIGDYGIS